MKLPDIDARRRAVSDFDTNLVVLAGAGTGKTSLLVERALNAVTSGVAPMDRIAAITFTEKAAGEMRERLALGLDRLRRLALGEVAPDDADAADRAFRWLTDDRGLEAESIASRALAALEQVDAGTVSTIHAFCADLLRRHPIEARVDPDFIVDSGEQLRSLCRAEWERFITRELGPEGRGTARASMWAELLGLVPLEIVGEVAQAVSGFDVPPELLDPAADESTRYGLLPPEELFAEEVGRLAADIESMLSRQTGMTATQECYFRDVAAAFRALLDGGAEAYRRAVDASSVRDRLTKGALTRKTDIGEVSFEEMNALSKDSRKLAKRLYATDDATVRLLLDVVAPFAVEFRETFLRHGFVSFDGLLALTRDLLRDHPPVRRALKRHFRLLLVDEFQDTDPLQYEIVLLLAEEPEEEAAAAFEARLDPGRLFVVGDTKQSIYRFRGADYSAYRTAVDRIVEAGGMQLDLVGNFRSVPGIIDPVNALFEATHGCWDESGYQPPYVPIRAVRPADDTGPRVELWTVEMEEGARAVDRREAEGRLIAEEIQRVVEEGRCTHRQITILFRAFSNIAHYLRPLRERGIPFVVDGGREFLRRPEVAELMAAMKTLSQPSDPAALLAFLRSPAGGVPDTELAGYARAGGRWDWRGEVDGAAFPRVAACFEMLQGLAEETRHLPADVVVRRVLERTSQLPLGAAAFEGPQRVANLRKLAAAAGDLARDGKLSLEEVVEGLREGLLEDIETDRPLADDAAEAVRITSIHRMKGLENAWVFVPDLAREEYAGENRSPVVVTTLADGRRALAPRAGEILSTTRVFHDGEHTRHEKAEEVRVLYVALTRARERLVVLAGPTARSNAPWVDALAPWGYSVSAPPGDGDAIFDASVLHRTPTQGPMRRTRDEAPTEDAGRAVERYRRAVDTLNATTAPPVRAPSGLHEEVEAERQTARASVAVRGSRDAGKAVGIVAHRVLEEWRGEDRRALAPTLARLAREVAEETDVEADALLREATEILGSFLDSPLAERLRSADVVGREVPLLMRDASDRIFRGSIDLLYRDDDGTLVVADFKTDHEDDEATLRERHGDQIDVYTSGVARALDTETPPRAELWHLRSGKRIPLA